MRVSFPLRGEIQAVAKRAGLPYSDAVRDIVRLVAIAHLRGKDFLNEDCVLVGGMALRLRGSNRFTIFDTDSSTRRAPVSERDITDGLSFSVDELEITPSLIFDPVPRVPVMHVVEQTAEKILGWCANSLAKHYLDLGWIARDLLDELDSERLQEQCNVKLRINKELFNDFDRFDGVDDLVEPLSEPDQYYGPLNRDRDRRETGIHFLGDPMSLEEAKSHVRKGILPLLRA